MKVINLLIPFLITVHLIPTLAFADLPTEDFDSGNTPHEEKFGFGSIVYNKATRQIALFKEYNSVGGAILVNYGTPIGNLRSIESILNIVDPKQLLLVSTENKNFKAGQPIKFEKKKGNNLGNI